MKDKQRPAIKALCRLIANHASDLSRVSTMFGGVAFDGVRWVTIGTHKDEGTGENAGGRRVFINTENGRILKGGPRSWKGGKIDDPDTYDAPTESKTKAQESPKEVKPAAEESVRYAQSSPSTIDPSKRRVNKRAPKLKKNPHVAEPSQTDKSQPTTAYYSKTAQEVQDRLSTAFSELQEFQKQYKEETGRDLGIEPPQEVTKDVATIATKYKGMGFADVDTPEILFASDSIEEATKTLEKLWGAYTNDEVERTPSLEGAVSKYREAVTSQMLSLAKIRLDKTKNTTLNLKALDGVDDAYKWKAKEFKQAIKGADPRALAILNKIAPRNTYVVTDKVGRFEANESTHTIKLISSLDVDGAGRYPIVWKREFFTFVHECGHSAAYKLANSVGKYDIADIAGVSLAILEDLEGEGRLDGSDSKSASSRTKEMIAKGASREEVAKSLSVDLLGYESPSFVSTIKGSQCEIIEDDGTGEVRESVALSAKCCQALDEMGDYRDGEAIQDLFSSFYDWRNNKVPTPRRFDGVTKGHSFLDATEDIRTKGMGFASHRVHEFFANMFALDILGDPKSRQAVRKMFPKTTAIYDRILDIAKEE